ncbi:hypothetical protein EJ06DRAFT_526276 [Trichodelitschia bisporula]|uniref:Uncharacterized protein n=1 Tax=Trichodelitschia bisporula TaxID=703511 RepID=A0A6G1I7L0_9PEZI|nr:hypothetical protein EJ06DRAFT_526276 [Trichodelitschia bisporula]
MSRPNRSIKDFFKAPSSTPPTPAPRSTKPRSDPQTRTERVVAVAIDARKKPPPPRRPTPPPPNSLPTIPISSPLPTRRTSNRNQYDGMGDSDPIKPFEPLFSSFHSSGSRRVIKNGEEVVPPSDSEEGSDTSLEDLIVLIHREDDEKAAKEKEKARANPFADRKLSRSVSSTRQSWKLGSKASKAREPKTYKFDMIRLVQDTKEQREVEVRIAKTKELIASAPEPDAEGGMDEGLLTTIVEGSDSENQGMGKRVTDALARTEALEMEKVFNIFQDAPDPSAPYFPKGTLVENRSLAALMADPQRRHIAFQTGFVQRIASKIELPTPLLLWILDRITVEQNEDLIAPYIKTLQASGPHFAKHLTPDLLSTLLAKFGILPSALTPTAPTIPTDQPINQPARTIPINLIWLIDLFRRLAPNLPTTSRTHIIHALCRLSIDHSIATHAPLRRAIAAAQNAFIQAIPSAHSTAVLTEIGTTLLASITSPILRYRLICALPHTTPRTHHFRRQLALAFARNAPRDLSADLANPKLVAQVFVHLQRDPIYIISPRTDYAALRATVGMLDIAIDVGFHTFEFLAKDSGAPTPEPNDAEKTKERAKEEAEFNDKLDGLVNVLRYLVVQIKDPGATHMRRAEAKVALERLVQRLECGVRTRVKKVRDVYDDGERQRGMMEGFVRKKKVKIAVPKVVEGATQGINEAGKEAAGKEVTAVETKA